MHTNLSANCVISCPCILCLSFKHVLVISPELIREVETRMNRNYLPPALKMQQRNNSGGLSQSPPTSGGHHNSLYIGGSHYNASSNSSSYPTAGTNSSVTPSAATAALCNQSPLSLGSTTTSQTAQTAAVITGYASNRRIYGRACKLPPVQEVGKFYNFFSFILLSLSSIVCLLSRLNLITFI